MTGEPIRANLVKAVNRPSRKKARSVPVVGALSASTSLADAIAIFAVAAYGVFFLAAYALPETRWRVLRADA